jgi:Tol biopolymer transport system component
MSLGPEAPYQHDVYPSPSPDGRYVAWATDRETGDVFNLRLQVLDVETGAIRSLGVAGTGPRWSPIGEWIAFGRDAYLYVVRPDGTGLRQVSSYGYEPWVSWSPDGRWLVAERYGPVIDVIEVETGLTLPLGFTGYLATPAWRP